MSYRMVASVLGGEVYMIRGGDERLRGRVGSGWVGGSKDFKQRYGCGSGGREGENEDTKHCGLRYQRQENMDLYPAVRFLTSYHASTDTLARAPRWCQMLQLADASPSTSISRYGTRLRVLFACTRNCLNVDAFIIA